MAGGSPFQPPDVTNEVFIFGQSMPRGLARHQGTRSRLSRLNCWRRPDQLGLALTRAQAFPNPEVPGRDLDRAPDHSNEVGVRALQPIKPQVIRLHRQLASFERASASGRGCK
jgi:hypothetical protein